MVRRLLAAKVTEIPQGGVKQVDVDGTEYAICHAESGWYALHGTCPHQGGPLGHGALQGHMVVCPLHAWEFDCRTGENDFDPDCKVPTVQVVVQGDEVYLELP